MSPTPASSLNPARRRRMDASAVLQQLEEIHRLLGVGDAFPSQRELLERLDASERIVRGALDEFQRQGKILRRVGRGGSIVADPALAPQPGGAASIAGGRNGSSPSAALSSTVVAINRPDRSFFDHAIHLLHSCIENRDLTLNCRVVTSVTEASSLLRSDNERPLGYIVFSRPLYPIAQKLLEAGLPVVWVGAPSDGMVSTVPNVYGNHEQGGYQATKHLLGLGHRRLAFWGGEDLTRTLRWKGHERALNELRRRGESVTVELMGDADIEHWRARPEVGKDYFTRPDAPTGLLCWNDSFALELLTFLTYIGVRVPGDVSLVGYDNLPASAKVFPSLTTVDSNLEQQLESALDLLAGSPAPTSVVITVPILIRRDSSAALAPNA